jgi:outer membrane protein assembly factor BamD
LDASGAAGYAPSAVHPRLARPAVTALALALLGAVAAPLVGCEPSKQYGTGVLQYSENARRSYEEAMIAFKDHNWQEASLLFREVRRRFSFAREAPLAQLRLADIEYEQERYVEAITAYKQFVRENPKHPDVAWARMRMARSYYAQISDAILLPPQEQREQTAVVEASREIQQYLAEFPDGPEVAEMRKLGADALARLVAHELYVARFYVKKGKFDAALARVDYAIAKYPGSSRDVEAYILRGEVLLLLTRKKDAKATFLHVIEKYPEDPRTVQAKRYVDQLAKEGI